MKFSKTPPTESGFYWVQEYPDSKPDIVFVSAGERGILIVNFIGDPKDHDTSWCARWGDKIEEPTDE